MLGRQTMVIDRITDLLQLFKKHATTTVASMNAVLHNYHAITLNTRAFGRIISPFPFAEVTL